MTPVGGFDHNDRVLVIGLGRSGRASCAVLRARGAAVAATDEKPIAELAAAIAEIEAAGASFVMPQDLDGALAGTTAAVLSPGIPLNGALVRRIQAAGVPVSAGHRSSPSRGRRARPRRPRSSAPSSGTPACARASAATSATR